MGFKKTMSSLEAENRETEAMVPDLGLGKAGGVLRKGPLLGRRMLT